MKTDLQLVHSLRSELGLSESQFADYLTIDREYMHKFFRGWVKMEPTFAEILAVVSNTPTHQWMYLSSIRKTNNYTPEGIDSFIEKNDRKSSQRTKTRHRNRREYSDGENRRHDKRVRKAKRRW